MSLIPRDAIVRSRIAKWAAQRCPARIALIESISDMAEKHGFIAKMQTALWTYGSLTAAQEAAVERIIAERRS